MLLSEKRKTALYSSIHDQIMDLRIKYQKGEVKDLDSELFDLEIKIWKEQKKVLKLK